MSNNLKKLVRDIKERASIGHAQAARVVRNIGYEEASEMLDDGVTGGELVRRSGVIQSAIDRAKNAANR